MFGDKGISPVVSTILLVAIVVVIVGGVSVSIYRFMDKTPTDPSTGAILEFEETPEGMIVKPTNVGGPVTVELDGDPVTKITKSDVGKEIFLPTSPGDQLTVTTCEDAGNVLMNKKIHQGEAGDFVAYYKFNSGGDNIIDETGNGNTGKIEGNPEWLTDGDSSLKFNGENEYIVVNDISAPVNVSEFTIAVAYRQQGEGDDDVSQLIEHRWGSNEWFLETRTDTLETYRVEYAVNFPDSEGQIQTGYDYNFGNHHVVVGTYDGKEFDLYMDSNKKESGSFEREVSMGDMKIARDFEQDFQYFKGNIYEIRLYYTAFDEDRIDTLTKVMSLG